MNKVFKHALIASLIVVTYGLCWHSLKVTPNDFQSAIMWLPLYISPIWGIAGASYFSERRKKHSNT
jgi:hypothetical protein